ncbi:hypothetical protein BOX15_Mlig010341g1, partial [Macrostomum lignano]
TFARQYWLYDCYKQCPMLSAERISRYLRGLHKPISAPDLTEVGDFVVVINTRHIAAKDNSRFWDRLLYTQHTRFPSFRREETMREMHCRDPTLVMKSEIRATMPSKLRERPIALARAFLHPDGLDTVNKNLLNNITGVIEQVLPVPKRLDEYSKQELDEVPRLFELPENHILDRRQLSDRPKDA